MTEDDAKAFALWLIADGYRRDHREEIRDRADELAREAMAGGDWGNPWDAAEPCLNCPHCTDDAFAACCVAKALLVWHASRG
jgi:hypothetical protein